MTWIKICGTTNLEDARTAGQLEAPVVAGDAAGARQGQHDVLLGAGGQRVLPTGLEPQHPQYFTLEQARRFVAGTAESRMHRYDWEPVSLVPSRVIAGIKALGVDVANWES